METVLAAEGEGVGLEAPTARCPSPKLGEVEDALPQKIARFSGNPCVGLEGSGGGADATPVISSRRREILSFSPHPL
jgi:hypothetical protein